MWNHSPSIDVRGGLRHASDVTPAEWAVIAPHLPAPKPVGGPARSS